MKKEYISMLMHMYQDFYKENKKQEEIYKEKKKERGKDFFYFEEKDTIYSESMMHSIIVIINKLNNQS